jgi:DNA-binding response OmpR family regulator
VVANRFLAAEPRADRLRVLVVENNPTARERMRSALGDAYQVRFVSGSSEALDSMRADPPDLLVSEVDLPEGDGLRLCEAVRRMPESEHLPIMLVTDRASIQDKVAGFQAGADDYVVKPVDLRLFHARVRLLCRIKGLERSPGRGLSA